MWIKLVIPVFLAAAIVGFLWCGQTEQTPKTSAPTQHQEHGATAQGTADRVDNNVSKRVIARPDVNAASTTFSRHTCAPGDLPGPCSRRTKFWNELDAFGSQQGLTRDQQLQVQTILADTQMELDLLQESHSRAALRGEEQDFEQNFGELEMAMRESRQRIKAVLTPAQWRAWCRTTAFQTDLLALKLYSRPFDVPVFEELWMQLPE